MSWVSAAAATSAMSCGSTQATRPAPKGSTMRPRGDQRVLPIEDGREEGRLEHRRRDRGLRQPPLDRPVVAVQAAVDARDRDVRHLHDACDPRGLRGFDGVGLQLHLVAGRRGHEEQGAHPRHRTGERCGITEIAEHHVADGHAPHRLRPPYERAHGARRPASARVPPARRDRRPHRRRAPSCVRVSPVTRAAAQPATARPCVSRDTDPTRLP